ncbi:MAG: repressor LexA [Candidatus Thermofonsia Clade 1 bacterium]|uniref:LexA repressor n=1 Tax=Candidatus Thermofonsia Clade 1 bacterium TaxID=2364210 RepID=A0A2M8PI48_9CHLR|nr:MAG: repressor LexA [Candidatus Thermofonsia Clade 1 bacterium]RMF52672.1 MAG: transcriptional repressor LexA [Chloroflexota bacterium]
MQDYNSLSEKQKAILRVIEEWIVQRGYPPTIRDIGNAVGISSTSVVNYNLNKLVEAGFVERSRTVSRGIRLSAKLMKEMPVRLSYADEVVRVPLLGRIVAGEPLPVLGDDFDHYDEDALLSVPSYLIGGVDPSQVYALKVSGYSMIDAMINDGDTVILRRQETARNGEMVAVWLPESGETTLKRFYDEGNRVRLQPANPTMQPIYVDKDKVQIQGKVLAVIRRLAS